MYVLAKYLHSRSNVRVLYALSYAPQRGLTREVRDQKMQEICYFPTFHSAPQPNESFNADANIGHRFAILMANVGALRPYWASGAG